MRTWFTADLHLDHDAIRVFCNRPFDSRQEMNEALIHNWNEVVDKRDTVYILGDFAWRNHNKYLSALRGRKILIRGNHDKMPQAVLRNFTEVHDLLGRAIRFGENGFYIFMCHYPMRSWDGRCQGSWHLHGHTHGSIPPHGLSFDVGVDCWDYYPISMEQVINKINQLREQGNWMEGESRYDKQRPL